MKSPCNILLIPNIEEESLLGFSTRCSISSNTILQTPFRSTLDEDSKSLNRIAIPMFLLRLTPSLFLTSATNELLHNLVVRVWSALDVPTQVPGRHLKPPLCLAKYLLLSISS
uniref:Uncharacterized protein n=1 Tax=Physcomitrium patens TaxID=3218 RepID=A0A7I3YWL3_PHYPA